MILEQNQIFKLSAMCTGDISGIVVGESPDFWSHNVNLNRHSWGLLGPQRDASVIFLESIHMKTTVFLLFTLVNVTEDNTLGS